MSRDIPTDIPIAPRSV
uniref:Uncharacterized protein n=1 Tax=Lepeophtheirus salmonis TaxID=72036 RepID=A0A0K2TX02_LEPSM